uniref:Uncharacterized protein n=1 Tax=Solanum tuberosum TaxID=4113 RepID=M1DRA4_SOLTU
MTIRRGRSSVADQVGDAPITPSHRWSSLAFNPKGSVTLGDPDCVTGPVGGPPNVQIHRQVDFSPSLAVWNFRRAVVPVAEWLWRFSAFFYLQPSFIFLSPFRPVVSLPFSFCLPCYKSTF